MFCSFSAAFGALLFLGRAPYAKSDYGQMWELDAIAAVVIGGTSLFGGRGSLWGTFMGVILLKLINNGLTLAQLDTFWQMVVTGMIILVAVGIDIVRQSKDPESVRKLLAAIGSIMAILAMMTPASIYLKAKVALLEHGAAQNLLDSGVKLATNQSSRLLSTNDISMFQEAASSNFLVSIMLLALVVASIFTIFKSNVMSTFVIAAIFVVMILPVSLLGYKITAPFLVLGALVLVGSASVYRLFDKARALDVNV
jgi:ABC-type xylose transport system permease subunit